MDALDICGPAEQSELGRQPEDSQLDDGVGGAVQAHGRRQPPSCDMDLVGRVKLTWLIWWPAHFVPTAASIRVAS